MLHRVGHVRTDVSEERSSSSIRVPPKRRSLQEPHGVTSQNTAFFTVTAVKSSNLTISVAVSRLANHTVRRGRRRHCKLLRVEGVAWPAQRILTAVNLGFLDCSRYFFHQVAPGLSS
jgi:hypothetical protein